MQNSDKKDGLPKIAEQAGINRAGLVIVLVAIAIIGCCYFFMMKSSKEAVQQVEETYTIKSDTAPSNVHAATSVTSGKDERKEVPVTREQFAAQLALVQEKRQQLQQRLSAPLMLVNNSQVPAQGDAKIENSSGKNSPQKAVETATAIVLSSLGTLIAQGNFIHAILEPAINSDLPGMLRAIVSEPVYAEDGSKILVPPGSRLIGEYKSGMMQGQSRIFIVWNRLITPEGISVQLESKGVDNLGVAGMGADSIDRHFWERFGTASLLSMIGVGTATVGVAPTDVNNSASAYRSAIANSFSQSASQSLQQDGNIAPTLTTMQGKPIMVFVARDLQFGDAIKSVKPSISVF